MPEEIPKFDTNKPYKDVSNGTNKEVSSSSTPPPFDPNKPYRSAAREAFQEEGFVPEKYVSDGGYEDMESTLDFVQNKMPGLRDMRDDEKDILRDIMKNPKATKEDISDAITTFKGVNPEQVYNQRARALTKEYYMDVDDKGVYKPIPIGEFKPLPAGKNIASVWGTGGEETQDDSWYTDLAKKAFNIIPSAMEGVTDLFTASSSALRSLGANIEGKEYEKTNATMAAEEAGKFFQQFKFPTSEEYNQQIYDAEGVKNFEDLISKDRFNISPKTIYGTVSNLAGSVGEMLLTGGAAAEGMLAKKTLTGLSSVKGIAPALSKAEKYASVYTGSFITNLGEAMDAAKKAGISDEDAGSFALALTIPIASLDAGLGIGGKILSNKLANQGKKELLENIASRVAKDEFGNITEESLKRASSEAVMAYTPVAKSLSKLMTKDVLEQGSEEFLQSFMSSAGEQLYDKLSDADKVKFGTDAFSAESFGKYISEGVAGLIGSGPLAVKTAKAKQQELYKAQSNSAYETVMQGEDAVKAFRTNVTNSFEKGEISKEDYDNAILKVDSYDSYEKVSKDLTLDNDNKKKLFELSLQKENLKAAIKFATEKDKEGKSRLDQMKPIELGLHNSKVEQADKIQKEIDLIVTKSEVLQQPEVAEKVVEKVVKAEEKATEGAKAKEGVSSEIGAILGRQYKVKTPVGGEVAVPGKAAYEVPKKVLEETRKMKDFSTEEWKIANATVKQAKFADALEEVPEKTVEGTLQQDNRYYDDKKGLWVQTYNLTLPNGKTAQFASSMVRFPEEGAIGGFRGNTYEENLTDRKNPYGQKLGATVRTLKDSGRKVIFIWNADEGPKYGKHIGMVREDAEGKSVYGAADLDEMADLRMINMGQNPNAPAPGIFTPKEPTKGGAPKVAVPIITTNMRNDLKGLKYSKAEIQAMTPQEATDIIKEQREKPKPKTELKEVEIKEKKAAAKANEAKRKAEVDAIIAEDKKKTGGGYTTRTAAAKIDEVNARYAALEKPTSTPTDLETLKQTPADIDRISKETEAKIKRKDLFIGVGDFSSELGGSDMAAVPVSHKEINGIEFVEYAHPKTGSIDVIVTGKSENDFVGFYRLYENGKPTNKWSSKFENQSRNKEDFKTMISGIQEMLPQGHEYTEKTSISTDGLRIWNQQLDRGYELQYDENGKLKTNLVAINGDAIVNDLGIDVNKGEFENIKVKSKEEFEKVKKALLPYLQKFGLNENNIKWISGNIEITPTNEKAFGVTGTVKIDLPILKSTKQVTDIVINKKGFYTEDELEKHERAVQLKLDDYFDEAEKKYGSFEKANEEINKSGLKETTTHKKYWDLIEERDRLQRHNEKLLYDIVNNSLSRNKNISDDLKKSLIEYYFKMRPNQPAVHAFGSANLTGDNSISKLLSNESLPKLAKEIAKQRAEEMNLDFDALYSTISGWGKEKQQNFLEENAKIAKEIQTEIFKNISENYLNDSFELFQKASQRKGKVVVKKAPKEVVVEKQESIAKREALMESIRGASKLVAAYNGLTKAQKRSKIGVDLYKKIQDRAKEINYTTTISRGGTLQLIGEKGKRVYKTPVKRTEDQKAMEKEKKDALSAEPTSIAHAVILDIANGAQFDVGSLEKHFSESVLKNEMPSLLKDNKNGIKVGSYKTNYEQVFGQFEIENITEAQAAEEAAKALGDYFMDGFREAAIQDAIDINFKTKNENRSRSEVEALNEMQKEQEREEKELEDILAQEDLEKEEYRRQAEEEDARLGLPKIEEKPTEALKDVESTTTALSNAYYEQQKYDEHKEIKKIARLEDATTFTDISEAYHKAKKDGSNPELVKAVEDLLNKPKEGYLQKAKVKPATLNKFEKSVDLFYKTKDADGASKKRSLAAERREFLEKNPTVKYIDDNMKYIYKQLEDQNIIERKGECP